MTQFQTNYFRIRANERPPSSQGTMGRIVPNPAIKVALTNREEFIAEAILFQRIYILVNPSTKHFISPKKKSSNIDKTFKFDRTYNSIHF